MKQVILRIAARVRDRRAAVAIIVALAAPVLVGCSALAVDVTYWYGTHEALQTAVDAAALAASIAGQSGNASGTVAVQAADAATGAQFDFQANPALNGFAITEAAGALPGSTTYTVTASAPLPIFLSAIVPGFAASHPTTSATATAILAPQQVTEGAGGCVIALDKAAAAAIDVSGGAQITASNCGVFTNSNASSTNAPDTSDAIVVSGSGMIKATSVGAVGSIYVPQYSGYVGGAGGNGTAVYQNASAVTDPLASMGNPVPIPGLPQPPAPSPDTNVATSGYQLGYTPIYSAPWGGCSAPAYSANCYIEPGTFTGGISTNTNSFIAYTGLNASNGGSTYAISGGISLGSNGAATFEAGDYYLTGTTSSGTVSGYALTTDIPQFTIQGGTYYVNGGLNFSGSGALPFQLGQGVYVLQGYGAGANNGGGWALTSNVNNVTFTGGTYFFNGGLNLASYGTITFGPGIYYVANGNLNVSGSDKIIVNGATFVLENGAGFDFSGGSQSLDMQAPSSNCVSPASYPEAGYTNAFPYDGTDGEGICGVLIYQARTDSAPDAIAAGATDTANGIIYSPNAAFTLSGAGVLAAAPTPDGSCGTLSVLADTINVSGSAQIDASAAPGSAVGSITKTVYVNYLIK